MTAQQWIEQLDLQPHPEGGYFRETYRAAEAIAAAALPPHYGSARSVSTAIYFLLESGQHSAFHRVASDELWHFHAGSSLTLHLLTTEGNLQQQRLGLKMTAGDQPQRLIPAHHWFAATVNEADSFALVSCTVAPGFDFADFELADAGELAAAHPRHQEIIEQLSHHGAAE